MSNVIKFGILVIGAIVIALIVRVVIGSVTHRGVQDVATARVRVSAADLPMGLLIRDEDLGWKNVTATTVPPNAITFGSSGSTDLKGALLRHPVVAGTVLVLDDVILPNAPGFLAATLKPGLRATSVAVDDVSGNAGLIRPGDYVDLVLTQQMSGRTDSPELSVSSETVVEDVRVLAVGSEIQRPKSGDAPDTASRGRTVTFEVTPRTAEVIAIAARLGRLSLALRSFATESRDPTQHASAAEQTSPVWTGDVSRAVRELPKSRTTGGTIPKRAVAAQAVVVYRGSEKGDSVTTADRDAGSGVPPLPSTPMPQ